MKSDIAINVIDTPGIEEHDSIKDEHISKLFKEFRLLIKINLFVIILDPFDKNTYKSLQTII